MSHIPDGMETRRVESFSDNVISIILTIMVLQLKVPIGTGLNGLLERWPVFTSYAWSFLLVAIMWVNHHHLMKTARRPDAKLLWANNLLLFWLSLIPFATAYMGENHTLPVAVALYGAVLAMCMGSFSLLRQVIASEHQHDAAFKKASRHQQFKNMFAVGLYAASVPLAFVSIWIAFCIFILIPILYFLPQQKLENQS